MESITRILVGAGLGSPPSEYQEPKPRDKELEKALLNTAVGVLAGFVANGLILAFTWLDDPTKALWAGAYSFVVGASVFARLRTHYALDREIGYDGIQFLLDLLLLALASLGLGVIARGHFPHTLFWLATLGLGISLLLRNIRLYYGPSHYLRSAGSRILVGGIVLTALTAWQAVQFPCLVSVLPVLLCIASVWQMRKETRPATKVPLLVPPNPPLQMPRP